MKKTLLAAALIAGFAGVAKAETSVILYGIVDTGIAYEQVKFGDVKLSRTGMLDGGLSGNRWGLKGSEDLGDGLRANFRLESGFKLSNGSTAQRFADGSDRMFGRWATVGLSGDSWGSLDFGRQDNVASRYFVDAYGTGKWDTGSVNSFGGNVDGHRLDNAVVYQTPSFEGFQAAVGYTFKAAGDQAPKLKGGKDDNSNGWTAGLRYANGPIEVAATYDNVRLLNAAAFPTVSYKRASAYTVSGAYDFEVVKLSLAFGQSFDGYQFLNNADLENTVGYQKKYDVNSYAVSLAAPIGDGTLAGTYGLAQARKELKRDLKAAGGKNKQHNFGLSYDYPLSKRTTVYAIGGYTKNYNFSDNGKRTVAGVGVRHAF